MIEGEPSLVLSDEMWDWLKSFPKDVIDSDFFIEEVQHAAIEGCFMDRGTMLSIIGAVKSREALR